MSKKSQVPPSFKQERKTMTHAGRPSKFRARRGRSSAPGRAKGGSRREERFLAG